MIKIMVFGVIAAFIFLRFRSELTRPSTHGFYMFFGFESLLILFYLGAHWGGAFHWTRIFSGILLVASALMAVSGFYALKKHGRPHKDWEDTTRLIQEGIFRLIRHPLYASLMLLSVGILINHGTWATALVCLITLFFLLMASRAEEKENLLKFGDAYRRYQQETRRYIPFLI